MIRRPSLQGMSDKMSQVNHLYSGQFLSQVTLGTTLVNWNLL